jgi:hypothetical protein
MERCETCGNAYERTFKIFMNGKEHTFDCFECAIHALAPHCKNCDIPIIGHGLESGLDYFCCAGCARIHGVTDLKDHTDQSEGDVHLYP